MHLSDIYFHTFWIFSLELHKEFHNKFIYIEDFVIYLKENMTSIMFNKYYILYLWYASLAYMKNYVIQIYSFDSYNDLIKNKYGMLNLKAYKFVNTDTNVSCENIEYALAAPSYSSTTNNSLISFTCYKYQVTSIRAILLKYVTN